MLSRLMTRREQFVLGFLGVAILAGAGGLFWSRGAHSRPQPPAIESSLPTPVPAPSPADASDPQPAPKAEVVISVRGAVIAPGVYRLEEGSRVADLIKAAGGFMGADTSDINLAARLMDGTTLTVPERPDEGGMSAAVEVSNPPVYTISGQAAAAQSPSVQAIGTRRVNLNRATQAELETLPGIGPKLAQQIIQHREGGSFATIESLMDVPGIGQQRFEAVRDLVTVE